MVPYSMQSLLLRLLPHLHTKARMATVGCATLSKLMLQVILQAEGLIKNLKIIWLPA
jgi:hypothetical protein